MASKQENWVVRWGVLDHSCPSSAFIYLFISFFLQKSAGCTSRSCCFSWKKIPIRYYWSWKLKWKNPKQSASGPLIGDQQSNNPTLCTIFLFLKNNWNLQSALQENPKRRRKWKRKKEPSYYCHNLLMDQMWDWKVDLQGLEGGC